MPACGGALARCPVLSNLGSRGMLSLRQLSWQTGSKAMARLAPPAHCRITAAPAGACKNAWEAARMPCRHSDTAGVLLLCCDKAIQRHIRLLHSSSFRVHRSARLPCIQQRKCMQRLDSCSRLTLGGHSLAEEIPRCFGMCVLVQFSAQQAGWQRFCGCAVRAAVAASAALLSTVGHQLAAATGVWPREGRSESIS
jgi:hypothetical protein